MNYKDSKRILIELTFMIVLGAICAFGIVVTLIIANMKESL